MPPSTNILVIMVAIKPVITAIITPIKVIIAIESSLEVRYPGLLVPLASVCLNVPHPYSFPTTVNIFLRELKAVWEKARPQISPLAREVASKLGLGQEELEFAAVESALVRLNLEFCKRRRCSSCPVREG
ncbi:unnamed protein product, partial [marine sediment metagenome]